MTALRQPDATEKGNEHQSLPAGAYARFINADGVFDRWMVRKPCGCLAALGVDDVTEGAGGVTTSGVACFHEGTTRIVGGEWR